MTPLQERLQRETKETSKAQITAGNFHYVFTADELDTLIADIISETIKAGVSAIEGKTGTLKQSNEMPLTLDHAFDHAYDTGVADATATAVTALQEIKK